MAYKVNPDVCINCGACESACPVAAISEKDGKYIVIHALCHDKTLTQQRCASLFDPEIDNLPFLICRQIVREISELTNLHGCGITTECSSGEDKTMINIILPKAPSTATSSQTTTIS